MSKITLICLIVFCFVQISLCARIPRDTPENGESNEIGKIIENTFGSFMKKLDETFTKENLEKFSEDIKVFGEQIHKSGAELIAKFEKKD